MKAPWKKNRDGIKHENVKENNITNLHKNSMLHIF